MNGNTFNGDSRYFFSENLPFFSGLPQAWDASLNTGIGQSAIHTLWINSYLSFTISLTQLGIPWFLIQIFFWMVPAVVISFISAFTLYRFFFPQQKLGALLAGIIYTVNSYFLLILLGGQAGVGLVYSLIPYVLYRFFKLFRFPSFKNSVLAGLALSLQLLLDPRFVYLTILTIGAYWFCNMLWKNLNLKILLLWYFFPAFITCLLHAFWIIPLLLFRNASSASIQNLDSVTGFTFFSFADFSHTFSLLHPNWPENIFGKTYFMNPLFLILPLIAYSSLVFMQTHHSLLNKQVTGINSKLLNIEKGNILFFMLIGIAGAFMAKGANEPLGNINIWIFSIIPGMQMFRDPTKWYTLVAVSYAMLIPYSLYKFSETFLNFKKFQNYKKIFNIRRVVLSMGIIWVLLHGMTYYSHPVRKVFTKVPLEYVQLKEFIYDNDSFYRTLWIPQWQRFGYFSNLHPAIGRGEVIPIADPRYMAKQLKNEAIINKLNDLGVKYVILPYDSEGELFLKDHKYDDRLYLKTKNELDANPYLFKKINFGKILVYELKNAKDRFWTVSSSTLVWNEISATEYEIKLENDNIEDILVFSDSFDTNWIARFDIREQRSEIFKRSLNSFKVPEGVGSLKIYYEPQRWIDLGLVISFFTLFSLGMIMLLLPRKEDKYA